MGVLLAAIAPVFIIAFYIYFRDKYEKEPLGMLAKALVGGMISVIPVIFVEQALMALMPPMGKVGTAAWHAFVVAAFTEEIFKYLFLFLLVWRSRHFNEQFDGIVYAVFVSLGFALVENVMYVMEGGYQTALMRSLTAVPAHALFRVTMGFYFGIARRYEEIRRPYLFRAIGLPILLHGIYDFILMVEVSWLLLLFIPFVIYLWISGSRLIRTLSGVSVFRPEDDPD